MSRSSSGLRWLVRHQSVESTTRRPSAVRTRRNEVTGVPAGTSSAAATAAGAATSEQVSSAVPGSRPVEAISEETPKLRLRSLSRAGRCVT